MHLIANNQSLRYLKNDTFTLNLTMQCVPYISYQSVSDFMKDVGMSTCKLSLLLLLTHAHAQRGKVIGSVVVVSAKIARSRSLGEFASAICS